MSDTVARPAEYATADMRSWRLGQPSVVATGALTLGVFLLLLAPLVSPGRTFGGLYNHDMMVFFDGAHRILSGQIPNRDFHTPMGGLTYLLPAWGLRLGGSLGAMMPVATALFAFGIAPFIFYASASRLPLWAAAIFVVYVAMLIVAPVNPGESSIFPNFAMFYNRFGWATLSTLMLLALPRFEPRFGGIVADAVCVSALLLILFYLKVSYALVGLVFVFGMLLLSHARTFALYGLGGGLLGVLVIELVWRGAVGYFADIADASAVSGAVRGAAGGLVALASHNMQQGSAYAALLVLALVRRTQPLYLLASVYAAVTGLFLINQNAQLSELPTLLPAALVAVLGPRAKSKSPETGGGLAVVLLIGVLAAPGALNGAFALMFFHREASAPDRADVELDGLLASEIPFVSRGAPSSPLAVASPAATLAAAFRTGVAPTETMNILRHVRTRQPVGQAEYLWTVKEGATLLRDDPRLTGPVFTYDMSNPFNALLGRRPPRGDASWWGYGRNFNSDIFMAPEIALADVQVIMDPKDPAELLTARGLRKNYSNYVDKNFVLAQNSAYWLVYRRVSPGQSK